MFSLPSEGFMGSLAASFSRRKLNGHIVDCVCRHEITFQPFDLSLLAHFVPSPPLRWSLCWPSVLLGSVFADKIV